MTNLSRTGKSIRKMMFELCGKGNRVNAGTGRNMYGDTEYQIA